MSERDLSVLLVSGQPGSTGPLRSFLASRGLAVHVTTGPGAIHSLTFRSYGLVLVDIGDPAVDGVALTRKALELGDDSRVLLVVRPGAESELWRALAAGAADYVTGPLVPEELARKVERLRSPVAPAPWAFDDSTVVAESARMKALLEETVRASEVALPVFIEGELGSGRKTIASAMHRYGSTRTEDIVLSNLAAVPVDLMSTVLFGSTRGGPGVLASAGRGAVVLENIDAMPASVQLELVGVLDTGVVRPEGPRFGARLYCTAERDLDTLLSSGALQAGLHHRLHGVRLAVPPLRERVDDIAPLAAHFLRALSSDGPKAVFGVTPEALAALGHYVWPGNVLELANVMERSFILARDVVELRHLPPRISSVTVRDIPSPPDEPLREPGSD